MLIYTNNIMKTVGLILPMYRLVINEYNLLIIIMFSAFSCSSLKNQQESKLVQYDNLTGRYVYTFVEQMPNYKGGDIALVTDFAKYFHYNFQPNEDVQTKFEVQFVIDTKGHLIGARIYNKGTKILTKFEKSGLKALALLQSWEAGKYNGKNVNVILIKTINVDYNRSIIKDDASK
jgi:hypothetical protein